LRDLLAFPLGRHRADQFHELQLQQRQLQNRLLRLALRGTGESGGPGGGDGSHCQLVRRLRGPSHRDTNADQNGHADADQDSDTDHYPQRRNRDADGHAELLHLSAAHLEVKSRLGMRLPRPAATLASILPMVASPTSIACRRQVTDAVPDRDGGCAHVHPTAAAGATATARENPLAGLASN